MLNLWLNNTLAMLNVMDTVFDALSSKYAILGYIILLFVIIAVLVILIMTSDSKGSGASVIIQGSNGSRPVTSTLPAQSQIAAPRGGVTVQAVAQGAGAVQGAPKTKAKETAEEATEERAPRFCMLSRIDENKRIY
ncbi:MAG: hypothetical protein IJX51_00175, partial [Clostridia bacterium]|nr:hypothetical protein [Clostridia bacterium]